MLLRVAVQCSESHQPLHDKEQHWANVDGPIASLNVTLNLIVARATVLSWQQKLVRPILERTLDTDIVLAAINDMQER